MTSDEALKQIREKFNTRDVHDQFHSAVCVKLGPYKEHWGIADYDADKDEYYGQLVGVAHYVPFIGKTADDVQREFEKVVDKYVAALAASAFSPLNTELAALPPPQ